jgi:Flp pilus assembly protein CpaB
MGFADSVDTPNRLTLGPNRSARQACAGCSGRLAGGDGAIAMKKNLVPVLGIAVIVAILSTVIFYGLVAGKLSGPAGSGSSVVIASRAIAKGVTIAEQDVQVIQWSGPAPQGAHATIQEVIGLTTMEAIAANEAVTAPRIVSASSGAGAGLGIPKGMRAISVMVSDSTGLLGLLQRGHKVDVQAVHIKGNVTDVDVRTILENIEILRVETKPEPTPGRSTLPVVTLLIRPGDADRLAAVDSGAKVRLTLRNPLDGDLSPLSPATLTGVMSGRTAALNKPATPASGTAPPASGSGASAAPTPVPTASLR